MVLFEQKGEIAAHKVSIQVRFLLLDHDSLFEIGSVTDAASRR